MHTILDILDWLFSFSLMVIAVWFLIIITPLMNELRKDSADEDITESWKDVRAALRIHHTIIKNRIRRIK